MPSHSQPGAASQANFEAIVAEHQALVFRTLQRLTGSASRNTGRLEDLAQEVFLRLYRALPHFQGDSKLSTYLFRIILNVAQDEWKRRRRDRAHLVTPAFDPDEDLDAPTFIETLPSLAPNAEQLLSKAELLDTVNRALLTLPETERAVLILYHQEELSYEHIALTLNLPIGTVRTHLHRGRKRLAALINPPPPKPEPTFLSQTLTPHLIHKTSK